MIVIAKTMLKMKLTLLLNSSTKSRNVSKVNNKVAHLNSTDNYFRASTSINRH